MNKIILTFAFILALTGSAEASYTPPGTGGVPAGTSGQLQYNNAGAFGGVPVGTSGLPLVSTGTSTVPSYAINSIAGGGTSASTAQGALNNINGTPQKSAAYVVAPCTGFNDQIALTSAESAAYATRTSILIPVGVSSFGGFNYSCQIAGQWQLTHATVSIFAWPVNPNYDPNYPFAELTPVLEVNNSSVQSGVANNCAIDMNGNNLTVTNINLIGTTNTTGTVAICNSVNGGGHGSLTLAILSIFKSAISGFGSAIGCAVNTTTGACAGTLGNNLITVRSMGNVFNSNLWVAAGNFADYFSLDDEYGTNKFGLLNFTDFDCNCEAGLKFVANRIDQGSGVVGSGFGLINIEGYTGQSYIGGNQIIQGNTPFIWFKVHNKHFIIANNSISGAGLSTTAGEDADIVFSDTVAGSGDFTITANDFNNAGNSTLRPHYAISFNSGSVDDNINVTGNIGGTDGYSIAFYHLVTTPAHIISNNIGEASIFDTGINHSFGTQSNINMLDVSGGVAIGTGYAGIGTSPPNGAIIQGAVGIGTTVVTGSPLTVVGLGTSAPIGTAGANYVCVDAQGHVYQKASCP